MLKKHPCPCCNHLTLSKEPPGTYDLCPVCFWEDDPLQFLYPTYSSGTNKVSLKEARANFLNFGASKKRWIVRVRKPMLEEFA